MTDDERRNRNPAPELHSMSAEDFEANCPELHVADLKLTHVYILEGERLIASFNYLGKRPVLDPASLDTVVCHAFGGPRTGALVYLQARADGCLYAGDGKKIKLRKYSGPDA